MQILLSFTNPHVISNLYDFISSVEYKNIFRKLFNVSVGFSVADLCGQKTFFKHFCTKQKTESFGMTKGWINWQSFNLGVTLFNLD